MLPTAAAFEHPERVGERAAEYFGGLGATARTLPVLHRAEAEDADLAEHRARGPVRVPRRRFTVAPALGAQGLDALRRAARRLPGRRGAGGVGRGRDAAVRPDGRSPRGRVHRRPRRGEEPRGVPVPRHRRRPPPRTLDRPAPALGRARRRRRGDRADQAADGWNVAGAGAVTLYGIEGTPTYTTGDTVAGLPPDPRSPASSACSARGSAPRRASPRDRAASRASRRAPPRPPGCARAAPGCRCRRARGSGRCRG